MLGANFLSILDAARSGAEWAWERLYGDLAPSVLGYLRARGAGDPEDLTGEVFLQIVRDLPRFAGDERDFRAWVFVIAHHRLLDEGRRSTRRPVQLVADPDGATAAPDEVETEVLRSLAGERVRRLIGRLTPEQQEVILLRLLGDLTVEEVARAVGKRQGAVKALQRRGLAELERALSEEGVPF
jgi:RNA polymerase sigma-70 factor (ECF subfamily)